MGAMTETQTLQAAKQHRCTWCWQWIEKGETYMRYRFFNCGDAGTCKMHPECYGAMEDAAHSEGGWIEWVPGMERPAKSPLAVGEPCAGSFDGEGFYCRCKAKHPRDCITETAMTTDSCVRTLPKSIFENW